MAQYLIQAGVNKRSTSWVNQNDHNTGSYAGQSADIAWNQSGKLKITMYVNYYLSNLSGWNAGYDASDYAYLYVTCNTDSLNSGYGNARLQITKYGQDDNTGVSQAITAASATYKINLSSLSSAYKASLQTYLYYRDFRNAAVAPMNRSAYIKDMWLTKNYTITYNANGGSGAPSAQTAEETIGSETRNLSGTTPTRSGYSFLGWSTTKARADAGTVDYAPGAAVSVTGAITLYAAWKGLGSTFNTASTAVQTAGAFSATVNAFNSGYYQKIVFRKDSSSGTTLATSSAFRNSLSYTVPRTWFNSYGSISSMTVVAILYTYTNSSCTTQIGNTDSRTFTVTADSGMKPALASGVVTLSPVYTGTGSSAISGLYVKGFSKVKAVFDTSKITWGAGASAGPYAIKVDDVTTSGSGTTQTSSNVVSQAGTITVTYTVTDSRGLSASGTETITVLNYAVPTIAVARCERTTQDGTADEEGAYITVRASANRAAVGTNAVSMTVAFRSVSGSYGAETALTGGVNLTIGGAISPDVTYFVRITATDSLGSVTELTTTLPARTWPLHMIKDGAAFGQKATEHNAVRFKDGMKILSRNADLADTGWIEPTLTSEFEQYLSNDFYKVRYRKVGGVVHLAGTIKPTATITGNTDTHAIFTLPAGFRPASTIDVVCQGSTTCIWLLQVHYTGVVSFSRYRNENGYQSAGTSVWLPFYATFIPA